MNNISSFEFQGMRTDLGDKLLDVKYFRDVVNFNQNDIIGANKVLAPVAINAIEYEQGKAIDGIFGYSYLDEDNKLQNIKIIITGGCIYAENGSKINKIYEGLEEGLCDFAILNDKLATLSPKINAKGSIQNIGRRNKALTPIEKVYDLFINKYTNPIIRANQDIKQIDE